MITLQPHPDESLKVLSQGCLLAGHAIYFNRKHIRVGLYLKIEINRFFARKMLICLTGKIYSFELPSAQNNT